MSTDSLPPDLETLEVVLREDESLFARDVVDGQLIRFEKATSDDFRTDVTLVIDGREITVKAAVPATDAQGNILNDAEGTPIPRRTTIYDAARLLFGGENPIPVLCHQDHMPPVGVCRICMVQIEQEKKGRKMVQLVPACTRRVEPGMTVHTIATSEAKTAEKINSCVKVLTELLAADHLHQTPEGAPNPANQLQGLVETRLGGARSRFPTNPQPRPRDDSSAVIAVDHSACVLCDRCVRACSQVKQNFVIGRSGKGYTAHIGFDLDEPMGESSCVSCGECMISCPTDALTYRDRVRQIDSRSKSAGNEFPTIDELRQIPLFRSLPAKFLEWNTGAVRRRQLKAGEVLCREGDYGSTAFVLIKGTFDVVKTGPATTTAPAKKKRGLFGWFSSPSAAAPQGEARSLGVRTPEDLILGEMTCLNNYPRSATVLALEEAEVLEINRNILYYLQRNPESRAELNRVYHVRALRNQMDNVPFIQGLSAAQRAECVEFLKDRINIVHVDPGQTIFREGDLADDLYLVRLGYVKISRKTPAGELVLDYFGPDRQFGEIAVLSDRRGTQQPHVARIYDAIQPLIPPKSRGVRTATCSALDHVELVRIRGEDFRALIESQPLLADTLIAYVRSLLAGETQSAAERGLPLKSFLDQGLYHAQKLLVLDLDSCTRCDECTRACADTHHGQTRLVREGLRFDRFLVASACRSCKDPYCLVGCPVDAIHRVADPKRPGALEIVIDSHCIGCGLCANNCPYGNISMQSEERVVEDPLRPGKTRKAEMRKATTCDLCRHIVGPDEDPSCVWACPHNAAFRMSGPDLLQVVEGKKSLSDMLH